MEMEMEVEMMVVDVAPAAATGRKRPAAAEGLEEEWRRDEELRGKAAKWNSVEDESRADFSPRVRELLHKTNRLLVRHYAAVRARRAREEQELSRLCPNSGILK